MKRAPWFIPVLLFATAWSCSGRQLPAQTAQQFHEGFVPRIHFQSGADQWETQAEEELFQNVAWLQQHPRAVIVLEGHCDEWGSDQFNLELGDRRARRVKAHLITAGIEADRLIMVVSHGEERPLDLRHTADAWRQNRRVEFIVR